MYITLLGFLTETETPAGTSLDGVLTVMFYVAPGAFNLLLGEVKYLKANSLVFYSKLNLWTLLNYVLQGILLVLQILHRILSSLILCRCLPPDKIRKKSMLD